MKLLLLCALALVAPVLLATEDPVIAALRVADDERVAATHAGDRQRLEAIYASELHYAHSSGKVDNRAEHIDLLVQKKGSYARHEYAQREFRLIGPGAAIMLGRVLIHSTSKGKAQTSDVNYLAVWRLEQGHWRFAAWQACKNPPAESRK